MEDGRCRAVGPVWTDALFQEAAGPEAGPFLVVYGLDHQRGCTRRTRASASSNARFYRSQNPSDDFHSAAAVWGPQSELARRLAGRARRFIQGLLASLQVLVSNMRGIPGPQHRRSPGSSGGRSGCRCRPDIYDIARHVLRRAVVQIWLKSSARVLPAREKLTSTTLARPGQLSGQFAQAFIFRDSNTEAARFDFRQVLFGEPQESHGCIGLAVVPGELP